MMRKLVIYAVLIPLAIVIVAFAAANRDIITVSFDPFSPTQPAFSLKTPLFVAMFAFVITGVVIGGFAAWLKQGQYRRQARNLQAEIRHLKREIEVMNVRLESGAHGAPSDASRLTFHPPA
jgi:uncharacterized integral membrane protein